MENLNAETSNVNSETSDDHLIGHISGCTVTEILPSRGEGVKVVFDLPEGKGSKTAYFGAGSTLPKAGDVIRVSAWKQAAGNVQFRRETTTEKDLEGLLD